MSQTLSPTATISMNKMGNPHIEAVSKRLLNAYKDQLFASLKASWSKDVETLKSIRSKSPFARHLASLHREFLKYEDPQSQEAALNAIDLEKIYAGVDKRSNEQDEKIKKGECVEPLLGYTDFIVLEVLKWYKNDFFKWTNEPATSNPAQGKPKLIGSAQPTPEEIKYGASITEVYKCDDGSIIRFPRYNDPVKLLETRNGRCGEWNNCFCLILRALGIRIRSVWNAEDHVWCEFYSDSQKRWIHLDSCEEAFDNPNLYNKGWGKKMTYVIAFNLEGIYDVSKRYVVESDKALPRNKISESDLRQFLRCFTSVLRKNMDKEELFKLTVENNVEALELKGLKRPTYIQTAELPRQSGTVEWTTTRGEAGK